MFKTLDDIDFAGRRVILRGDLNVPMRDGRVTDATRLDRLAPTINELAESGARVIVISHFGRPKGAPAPELSLRPVATALERALDGRPVAFAPDCIGAEAQAAVAALEPGAVILLENLRFHPGEEANDAGFGNPARGFGKAHPRQESASVCFCFRWWTVEGSNLRPMDQKPVGRSSRPVKAKCSINTLSYQCSGRPM